MFGYVVPDKPELKIKEYELYKSYYCGICHSIKRRYGNIPRLTLTYDSTFLAVLISSLLKEKSRLKSKRCGLHPVRKIQIAYDSYAVDYAADMNILLTWYKFKDNKDDEGSMLSAAVMLLLRNAYKKININYKEKCGIISDRLSELSLLEADGDTSLDAAAEPFSKLMEELLTVPGVSQNDTEILRWLGYNLGKWIYTIDAVDDIEKDIKKGSFNPLRQVVEGITDKEKRSEVITEKYEYLLIHMLAEISKAYELLNIKTNKGIIENIIYSGILKKTEQILKKGSCKNKDESI